MGTRFPRQEQKSAVGTTGGAAIVGVEKGGSNGCGFVNALLHRQVASQKTYLQILGDMVTNVYEHAFELL